MNAVDWLLSLADSTRANQRNAFQRGYNSRRSGVSCERTATYVYSALVGYRDRSLGFFFKSVFGTAKLGRDFAVLPDSLTVDESTRHYHRHELGTIQEIESGSAQNRFVNLYGSEISEDGN